MGRRAVAVLFCALLPLLFLAGCNDAGRQPERPQERIYRIPLTDNPDTLDPAHFTGVTAEGVARRIFNGLVKLNRQLEPSPDLAESWTVAPDALTYTFQLRRGVRFHNGRELTADDVRYSFERLLRADTASHRAWVVSAIRGAQAMRDEEADSLEGFVAPDDYTVVLTLEKPFAPFLCHLAMGNASIVPKEEVEKEGEPFGRRPVGTGPFRFVQWEENSVIELTRNEEYFAGPAHLDGLRFRVIAEPLVAYQEYLAGHLEHCSVPEGYLSQVKSGPHAGELRRAATLSTYYIGIMMSHEPCGSNVHLRRAMNCAVDRRHLCEKVLGESHIPARGVIPPGLPAHDPEIEGYVYDPDRAREELEKAGFGSENPVPELTFYFRSKPPTPLIAQAIQSDLAAVGIPVELRRLDFAALREATNEQEPDLFYLSWIADFPDSINFLECFDSRKWGGAGNRACFADKRIDALLDQAGSSPEYAQRIELYRDIERRIVEQAPWIFLSHKQTQLLVKPYVRGFELTAMDVGTSVNLVDFHEVEFAD